MRCTSWRYFWACGAENCWASIGLTLTWTAKRSRSGTASSGPGVNCVSKHPRHADPGVPCLSPLRLSPPFDGNRVIQAAERLAAGSSWADNGLVFATSLGTPTEPRNLTRHFYGVRDRAGLPEIRLHDLRHTCLTLLLNLGTSPHIAQAIAGH